ncbi:MAG TPA: DUF6443 domain-containing protein [Pyrinomonadaceae bacterium]|nr:DUF6443 domain-containing protein [Pyrinomonadaceae bacterium]
MNSNNQNNVIGLRVPLSEPMVRPAMRRMLRAWLATFVILVMMIVTAPVSTLAEDGPPLTEWDAMTRESRDLHEAQVRYEEQQWMDERVADMRASWDTFNEMKAQLEGSYLSAIPRPPAVGPRFSSNSFGATYEVPFGRYSGDGLVGLLEVIRQDANPIPIARSITRGQQGLRLIGSGWTFEPGAMLKETYSLLSATVVGGPTPVTQCKVVDRFQYVKPSTGGGTEFLNKGVEQSCDFNLTSQTPDACASSAPSRCNASRPTQYWSANGQVLLDLTDINVPVLRYPDGTSETLKHQAPNAYIPFNEGLLDSGAGSAFINGVWFTDKTLEKNGYITSFSYDDSTGWLRSVTDPKGRVTQYDRDGSSRVLKITAPGAGGGKLSWNMAWQTFTWDPHTLFSDIQCLGGENFPVPCAGQLSYTTLTGLSIPDGHSYTFAYNPPTPNNAPPGWGNLYSVTTPEGAVNAFEYGNGNTTWVAAPRFGGVPDYTDKLDKRHLSATTVYPQGIVNPGFTTHFDFDVVQSLAGAPGCSQLNWTKRTYPNGDVMREAQCGTFLSAFPFAYGRTFAQEVWQGGQMLQGTYYGNTGGDLADTSTAVGDMYVEGEAIQGNSPLQVDLDVRPTKVIHIKDGIQWTEKFQYEFGNIPVTPRCSSCTAFRTTGNILETQILDDTDNLEMTTSRTYYHSIHPLYLNRNLLRLPASTVLKDADEVVLSRTEYEYDEYSPQFPLTASGALNLDTSLGVRRGNETTVRQFKDAANSLGPIVSRKTYFDTGDVSAVYDPNQNPPAQMNYDFSLCSASHLTLLNSARNPKDHLVTNVSDCNTGLVLRATDPNNQSTYTQYDEFGRVVEVAVPGDTLTRLPAVVPQSTPTLGSPHYVKDPNIPFNRTNGGTVVGSGGQGPTTWIEYLELGVIGKQRRIDHTKDGTVNGRYLKTFTDGLGRTIQTRSEVDPSVSSGNAEVKTNIEYDSLGRTSKTYVPVFAGASDSFEAPPASGARVTVTAYDGLGRVKVTTAPGPLIITTDYGKSGSRFTTTVTDPKGNQTVTFTDILGHKVQVRQKSPTCIDPIAPGWCVTQMQYDAAGRLLVITDPLLNQTTFTNDSLGRKMHMTDPDMGSWDYDYDNNGNLVYQKDAKGQIILMTYDPLNRILIKDLPPSRPTPTAIPGPEDARYFYDGDH